MDVKWYLSKVFIYISLIISDSIFLVFSGNLFSLEKCLFKSFVHVCNFLRLLLLLLTYRSSLF